LSVGTAEEFAMCSCRAAVRENEVFMNIYGEYKCYWAYFDRDD
jgi:hypothetical protein